MNETGLLTLIQKFKDFASEVYSPNTVSSYLFDLRDYCRFMIDYKGIDELKIEICDRLSIRSYLANLHRRNYQSSSITRRIASLSCFFDYLKRYGIIEYNPARDLPHPKKAQSLPPMIGEEQLNRIMDALPSENAVQKRDRAVMELFYGGGLRLAELINLKINDFEGGNFIRVLGKGSKERLAPLGRRAIEALNDYLPARQEILKNKFSEYLFVSGRGNHMERRYIQRMVKRNLEAVSGELSPHSLRHAFATHLLRKGAELPVIQELLGHQNLTATQIYTHFVPSDLLNIYKSAHPRA